MSKYQDLYIWLEGDIEQLPKIEVKAAPSMPLQEFRDNYVDTDKSYLIMRIYAATDDEGNTFAVALQPPVETVHQTSETISATRLSAIKGIGRKYTTLLREKAKVASVEDLREAGATPAGRASLAQLIGRSENIILRWVQIADLMRLEGVGEDYSALLWEAGITSVPQLATKTPDYLEQLLTKTNEQMNLVNRLPWADQITSWIEQAKRLPGLIDV